VRRAALAVVAAAVLAVPAAHAHTWCGAQIASARWVALPQGKRLIVRPTQCGRRTAFRSPKAAFAEAIRRGGHGAPDRGSLYWQFLCHAEFASFKATWDLEAWRPDVGLAGTIAAGCNPD
jgi:Protein of unknown function (DUF2599)